MDDVWPDDTLLELQGLARGGTGPAPGANSTPTNTDNSVSKAVNAFVKNLGNADKAVNNLDPFTRAVRTSVQSGGLPYYLQYNPIYSLAREFNLIPSPFAASKAVGLPDPMTDAPVFRDPYVGGAVAAAPTASVLWSLIKRKGGKTLLKNLARHVGAEATSGAFIKYFPSILFAEENVRRNMGPIASLTNFFTGKGVDANGNPISRSKSLSNAGRKFLDIGEARLRNGSPAYQEALKGSKDQVSQGGMVSALWHSRPMRMWRQRLADLVVDPGTSFNTTAAGIRAVWQAARDAGKANENVSYVIGQNAGRAAQAARSGKRPMPAPPDILRDASFLGNLQRMYGSRGPGVVSSGIISRGEPVGVHSLTSPSAAASFVAKRPSIHKYVGQLPFRSKDYFERLTDYHIPDSNSQHYSRSSHESDVWNRQHPQQAAIAAKQNQSIKQQRNAWIRKHYNRNGTPR